jgi:hypothetical protein
VPVVQSAGGGSNAVTIMFKEFGVRLSFTPTILGNDLINLKVKPEVSALDFANGVNVGGFRVPALSTRKTETEVELQDGQTFAIAGLMNNTVNSTMSKIPGIGDIPILGYLFKSRSYQKAETELVVMITPQIVRRGSTGVSSSLPSIVEPYLSAPGKTMAQPAPYTGSPRYPVTQAPTAPRSGAAQPKTDEPQTDATTAAPAPQPTSQPVQPNTMTAPAATTTAPAATPQAADAAQQPAADQPAPKPTKAEQKALAQQQAKEKEQQKKDADAAAKAQVAAAKKAAADKEHESKLAAEQQKKDAEAAKKAAEAEHKKQDDQKKKDKDKAVADAAERLRQAQADYEKTKGGKQ